MAQFNGNFEYVGEGGELTSAQESLLQNLGALGISSTYNFLQKNGASSFINKDATDYFYTKAEINLKVSKSIVLVGDKFQLSGDENTPGASKYYGTNSAGTKGFFTLPNPDLSAYQALKKTVEDKTDTYNVVVGDTGKVLTMSHANTKIFNLPELVTADIGTQITFVKKGAGQVTIQAYTGQKIADSSTAAGGATGQIYNDVTFETFSTITLLAITTTLWVIVAIDGTWTAV